MTTPLDRRQFHQLSAAALAGLIAGAAQGCGGSSEPAANGVAAAGEKHLCRGLNDCKGQGKSGMNDCRGQGTCATYPEQACATQNACKGQGGCGENPGLNDCKGQGGCHVPLMDSAWEKVRTRMEEKWKAAGQEFAAAPPAEM